MTLSNFCRHMVLAGLCLTWLTEGCTSQKSEHPPTIAVTGIVTCNDEPVEGATISFERVDGTQGAIGRTDSDGRFQLTTFELDDGARAGEYRVEISKYAPQAEKPPKGTSPPLIPLLPEKYAHANSSGLTASVSLESNSFNFTIEK